MRIVVWVFAIYLVVVGLMTVVSPELARRMGRWFMTPLRTRLTSLLSVALGIVLFEVRHSTGLPVLVGILGLLTAIGSLVYLVLPWIAMERLYEWWLRVPDIEFRVYGAISALLGVILIVSLLIK